MTGDDTLAPPPSVPARKWTAFLREFGIPCEHVPALRRALIPPKWLVAAGESATLPRSKRAQTRVLRQALDRVKKGDPPNFRHKAALAFLLRAESAVRAARENARTPPEDRAPICDYEKHVEFQHWFQTAWCRPAALEPALAGALAMVEQHHVVPAAQHENQLQVVMREQPIFALALFWRKRLGRELSNENRGFGNFATAALGLLNTDIKPATALEIARRTISD